MSTSISLKLVFAVGIGGMIGAISRYSIALVIVEDSIFPFATLIANLIGCFLLSYLLNHHLLKDKLTPELFTALTTGVIGSFTTFSTFAVEVITTWNTSILLAIIYLTSNLFGGLALCYVGYRISPSIRRATS
ncbi:CrcB protein [Ornithinibacillus sp. L9]|uniref:Fluoride-specific ion channel FluC n=1 Tax=Ornithinibacillus caprae TaxID=2678566 RepID=A0A6N8FKH5_9BACI|nr:CrcB family protein [Ornithinibacillus caprae]MUK89975.1 CrcB protein [Ornithinibacillus caprae]